MPVYLSLLPFIRGCGLALDRTQLQHDWVYGCLCSFAEVMVKMGRGTFKGKPTDRHQFSTPEEMSKPPFFLFFFSLFLFGFVENLGILKFCFYSNVSQLSSFHCCLP